MHMLLDVNRNGRIYLISADVQFIIRKKTLLKRRLSYEYQYNADITCMSLLGGFLYEETEGDS